MSYATDFGRAIAQWKRKSLTSEYLRKLVRDAGAEGSLAEIEALCGALDEMTRLYAVEVVAVVDGANSPVSATTETLNNLPVVHSTKKKYTWHRH